MCIRDRPNDEDRRTVEMMAAIGTTQENIARCVGGGVDIKTLVKYYREELDTAGIKACAKVGGAMYNKAIGGDVQAQKYFLGCRAGWKETVKVENEVTVAPPKVAEEVDAIFNTPTVLDDEEETLH
jgi:hypothetical protein